jgi:hypothetical protein
MGGGGVGTQGNAGFVIVANWADIIQVGTYEGIGVGVYEGVSGSGSIDVSILP